MLELLLSLSPALGAAPCANGSLPLHMAACAAQHSEQKVRLLLKAAPSAALAIGSHQRILPLHYAASRGDAAAAALLLEAAPASAGTCDRDGRTPLDLLLQHTADGVITECRMRTARVLIAAPGQQLTHLLQSLSNGRRRPGWMERMVLPLYADVAARYPLASADWQLIPAPCPGLGAALPTVLQRSPAEAALLVARLPDAECRRLCACALALHRAQARLGTALPQPLAWRILAACVA